MPVPRHLLVVSALLIALTASASAGDVRVSIPKRTKPTPVQKLNQDGVKEVQKHNYKKAKALFYKAYLIDPNDPFTLNNLGYIAELEGQADRAQRYYSLAQEQGSDALVYKSTEKAAIGKPVGQIAGTAADAKMQVNRINVYAIGLLQKDQAPQADLALQKALKLDPTNAFTLNNIGYAREKEGELEDAYKFYTQAADQNSDTPIVVTMKQSWRGKGISSIAAANARKVQNLMEHEQSISAKVARLNTRGVAAINRNDYKLARSYFEQSYKLDPKNAFALNNMGYLAEMDGDRETADFYYDKAREADQSSMKVAYASRKDVEGMKLSSVAGDSDDAVNKAVEEAAALRRSEGGPVVLRYRNNEPVMEPATPPQPKPTEPPPSAQPAPSSGGQLLEPLPDNQQPPAAQPNGGQPAAQPNGGIIEPLPDNQQPPAAQPNNGQPPAQPNNGQPAQPPQGNNSPANPNGGLMMPLPDNQQPPTARDPNAPASQPNQNQQQQPQQVPPQSQSAPPPQNSQPANSNNGIMMPLPDDQQPPAAKQPQQ
jgi:Flp pilus assembly protein TadD